MRSFVFALACALLFARQSYAQEATEKSPDEVTTGQVRITMNTEYAKIEVDGQEWEAHEFVEQGRTIVIHGLDRTKAHTVMIRPVTSRLQPLEVEIRPEDWKLVTIDKKSKTKMWRVEKKVTLPAIQ